MRRGLVLLTAMSTLVACAGALAACASVLARGSQSGLSGRIVAGPVCPVERMPPQPGCAPRPLVATLRVRRAGSRSVVGSVRSHSDGRFRVSLAPGDYVVQALARSGSPFPRPPLPLHVTIRRGRFLRVTVVYDTGIR